MAIATTAPDSAPAHRAKYIAVCLRAPYALDVAQLGFAPGIREDYRYRQHRYDTLDLPVFMLDNNFKNPDLKRMVDKCHQYTPTVAVIGDTGDPERMRDLAAVARDLRDQEIVDEPVLVPKSKAALEAAPRDLVVGYPNGYSSTTAGDFSRPGDWRDRRVHILGGSPQRSWAVVQELTGASTPGHGLGAFGASPEPLADVVGLDYNGIFGVAQMGEYWHRDGNPYWQRADHLTIRATVRRSLEQMRLFWKERGVWPTSPAVDVDAVLSAPSDPENPYCLRCGQHTDWEDDRILVEYDDGRTRAFCSQGCREWIEYHHPMVPLDLDQHDDPLYPHDRVRPDHVGPE